jgi:hypothetical protein
VTPTTPPEIERLVRACLAKNPDERWQSARDLKRELEWMAAGSGSAAHSGPALHRPKGAWSPATIAAVLVALVGVALLARSILPGLKGNNPPVRVTRTTIVTSGAAAIAIRPGRSLAMTPDGARIVYIGNNGTQIFVRSTRSA